MNISAQLSGISDSGRDIFKFIIDAPGGMKVAVTNLGGTVLSVLLPEAGGTFKDVVLGYEDVYSYLDNLPMFGVLLGRCAGRIKRAGICLNGHDYRLSENKPGLHSHGGVNGFHKKVFTPYIKGKVGEMIEPKETDVLLSAEALVLEYCSRDGEEGYPGNLKVRVTYSVINGDSLKIEYSAISDKDTIVSLSNHIYFNLTGNACEDVLNHEIMIDADCITPIDDELVPDGSVLNVEETPFDFRTQKAIGKSISDKHPQMQLAGGYDHNWILNGSGNLDVPSIRVVEPKSGSVMEVYTSMPGVQFYVSDFSNYCVMGKGGQKYNKKCGFCLETQFPPDAAHHPNFPSPFLKAGEEYDHTTIFSFKK
jgi:aldose 1-epimerase